MQVEVVYDHGKALSYTYFGTPCTNDNCKQLARLPGHSGSVSLLQSAHPVGVVLEEAATTARVAISGT